MLTFCCYFSLIKTPFKKYLIFYFDQSHMGPRLAVSTSFLTHHSSGGEKPEQDPCQGRKELHVKRKQVHCCFPLLRTPLQIFQVIKFLLPRLPVQYHRLKIKPVVAYAIRESWVYRKRQALGSGRRGLLLLTHSWLAVCSWASCSNP